MILGKSANAKITYRFFINRHNLYIFPAPFSSMAKDKLSYWAQVLLILSGLNVGLGELGYAFLGMIPGTLGTIVTYLIGLSALYLGYGLLTSK